MVELHLLDVEGNPSDGYYKICPYGITEVRNVRLTNTRQRHRYGLNRPTQERPVFVGSPSCSRCMYNAQMVTGGWVNGTFVKRSPLVVCSYPLLAGLPDVREAWEQLKPTAVQVPEP